MSRSLRRRRQPVAGVQGKDVRCRSFSGGSLWKCKPDVVNGALLVIPVLASWSQDVDLELAEALHSRLPSAWLPFNHC